MFSGEDVKVSTISNKYILNNESNYKDVLFETPNYYPRKYSVSNDLIDTKKFEIVDSTNFIPWDENYTLDKMLDGNINTYAHNNSIISEPVTIIIDMKQNQKFNYFQMICIKIKHLNHLQHTNQMLLEYDFGHDFFQIFQDN